MTAPSLAELADILATRGEYYPPEDEPGIMIRLTERDELIRILRSLAEPSDGLVAAIHALRFPYKDHAVGTISDYDWIQQADVLLERASKRIAALEQRIPREPTQVMIDAADNCYWTDFRHRWIAAYVAWQIDAAQSQEPKT